MTDMPDASPPYPPPGWWLASDGQWYPPHPVPPYPVSPYAVPPYPMMSPNDERTWAMLSHLSHFFGSWIAQLIIMSTKGRQSAYVRDQAVEALNFSITMAIAMVVSAVLCLIIIGFVLLAAVLIISVIFPILGAVSANRGERYRYPISLRLVH